MATSARPPGQASPGPTFPQLVVALTLATCLLLALSWLVARPAVIDVGEADATLSGFYTPEVGPQGRFRWTGSHSEVTFPGIGASMWRLELTFATGQPPDALPPTVEILSGQQVLARFNPTDPGLRAYTVDMPIRNGSMEEITLAINTTPTYSPPGESRALGIAVDKIVLTPLAPVLPSLQSLLFLLLAVMIFALALKVISGRRLAGVGGLSLALVLSSLIAWNRLWLTPFSIYLPVMSTLFASIGLLHRTILRYALHRL